MSKYTFEYCDWSGLTKTVEHTEVEAKAMDEMLDIKARCQRVCNDYARKGYWTTYKKDGVELAHANAEVF